MAKVVEATEEVGSVAVDKGKSTNWVDHLYYRVRTTEYTKPTKLSPPQTYSRTHSSTGGGAGAETQARRPGARGDAFPARARRDARGDVRPDVPGGDGESAAQSSGGAGA